MTFKLGQSLLLKRAAPLCTNYSVSSAPGQNFYRISAKKESGNAAGWHGLVTLAQRCQELLMQDVMRSTLVEPFFVKALDEVDTVCPHENMLD
ncbi:hypothetical protein GQ600_6811 [Phytophthora cactorum]|nr:hypothetical protein GQ600_6811 [Phytophthora cactorum]